MTSDNLPAPKGTHLGLPKARLIGAIVIAGVVGTMAVTNPGKKAYVEFAADQFAPAIQDMYCQGIKLPEWANSIGKMTKGACKTAIATGSTVLGRDHKVEFINSSTRRQNLFLLSVYTMEMPGKTFKTIGVFGHFIPFS
jgi:hypothetical protein